MGKTLIVGGGLTGAALARLMQEAKITAGYASEIIVWERNSLLGGRVMSRSFPKQREIHVDMGAQYWTPKSAHNEKCRQKLMQSGYLVPFAESAIAQDPYKGSAKMHWVCPDGKGFRAVVEHLLEAIDTSFQLLDDKHIQVTTSDGEQEIVNALVLTCPIPNVLPILDKSCSLCIAPAIRRALEDVKFSQRFAAAYVFEQKANSFVQNLGWTAKYVLRDESDTIRFMCWDHLKKQTSKSMFPVLLVHTSVTFGSTYMDDTRNNDEILAMITEALRNIMPSLPTEQHARLHRWRISQVSMPYKDPNEIEANSPSSYLLLNRNPPIIVAGDSFLGSYFDSCLTSAKDVADLLLRSSTTT
ncbi:uncharacterized protein PHALS_05463 [Plasmopara halstedii]|uniref:Amine oxidase domain-containing protein n=1 Tax=Plasmopara halstedii TaxID=4781 RepID=A0A0P1B0R6_PLAHL|nr:uncharacterized protein PHALS_05463 [Plasmopara halstedii]CEG47980.1 hypothetical protein PHALS_05463 [Plasmopara halstedii]|eukprot:XP_024584349.1 hypothetical protein PHALS_05463 [Plasmopara halstedii]